MKSDSNPSFLRVASLAELEAKRVIVIPGADRPIAVYRHDGGVAAVDNRCPHLGFPLHKGTVKDGILTCHWHEARFDLCNGCTFDLWADDVPSFPTEIRDGDVYVSPVPAHPADRAYHERRLRHGLEHGISLIQGKALLGLRRVGVDWIDSLQEVARFGGQNHDRWGEGMTLLAIAANLLPDLSGETAYHVVFRAARQVAIDCSDAVPHRRREPLDDAPHPPEQLSRWMRNWIACRHRDGAERVLLTAADRLGPQRPLADLLFATASDRIYAQIGHVFDGANKAWELLDAIGWVYAPLVLPLIVPPMAAARGAEEDAHWHHPIEVVEPLRATEARLPGVLEAGAAHVPGDVTGDDDFLPVLLRDDPLKILEYLEGELQNGIAPAELSKRVAYAAAVRLARFAMANEVADWFNPRHTFIFANAVHQAVRRSASPDVVRSIYHAALSVYMDRFLNVPPARLPAERDLEGLPVDAEELRRSLLAQLDRHADVQGTAGTVMRYLRLGLPFERLVDTLAHATAREDLDFHAMQVLEAGVRQYREWNGGREGEQIMVGVVRQLAAFCPTPRAGHQMSTTAMRLERGDKIYEDDA